MMKRVVFGLLHASGLTRLFAWLNRGRVVIICYHGVTQRAERAPFDPAGLHVRAPRFEAQLDHLRRRYRVVALAEYLAARREGRSLPPYTAVLTFDDGYRNFLTAAAPRLRARSLPASVFLITDRVREDGGEQRGPLDGNAGGPAWSPVDDESYLSWKEIAELRRAGVEFGSHTCTHPKLPELAAGDAERELSSSLARLTERLGEGTPPLAYPYGDYTDALAARARELGYCCALTTDAGANGDDSDLYKLRRVLVGDGDDVPAFAARVSGLTAWVGRG
jgi:peptidoglycan/xylan/chitin deacetylase (PgdA/CDA1 family)